MIVPVILCGEMEQKFGREFRLSVDSAAEAIKFLIANLKGFRAYLVEHNKPGFHILVGNESQAVETLYFPCGDQVVRIVPAVVGAGGDGGFLQTIGGLALVALDTFYLHSGVLSKIGWAMALGGVSQMMAPSPSNGNNKDDSDAAGSSFNGSENVIAQGRKIPVAYGKVRVGSLVVSIGTSSDTTFATGKGGGPFGLNSLDLSSWVQMSGKGEVSAWFNGGNGDSIPWVWNVDPAL